MTTLLRSLIDEMGWKDYRTFIDQYQRAAQRLAEKVRDPSLATHTVSDRTFERWYSGRVTPQNEARRILAHLFMRPIHELLSEAPAKAPAPVVAGYVGEFSVSDTHVGAAPGADQYRMGRNAAMAARRAMQFAMGAEHNEVGPETMAYLQGETRRIAGIYTRVPLGTFLDDLTYLQDNAFRLLESGRAKPSQTRDLYFIASLLSGMLAKASHDLADPSSAMMQARTASVCAERAEHPGMSAWVRGLQSLISYWSGRPADALHFARQGTSVTTGVTGSVTVWLAGLEARAASVLGDASNVNAANLRAREAREQTVGDDLDELGGNFVFPACRQDYYEVEATVLLGHSALDRGLVASAERAVQGLSDQRDPHWAFGDEAGAQSNLALARLYAGDLEGAAAAAQPVLDLPPAQRNAGIIGSIDRVRVSLTRGPAHNTVLARDLREEIAMFGRQPTLALRR
ncbi:hypothetical protein PUR57_18045 [Streptomyces sp. JV176]|uniref:hypothetical protein n=1 Tax=Streptomyces sp. JV176 TaxID=858630 RepID=UPI002E76D997|nr:hypothetical protein [Streptomyces sp. JV176]MEE1800550.1 hypothetical protein [Streptomyces sp. JV176]